MAACFADLAGSIRSRLEYSAGDPELESGLARVMHNNKEGNQMTKPTTQSTTPEYVVAIRLFPDKYTTTLVQLKALPK